MELIKLDAPSPIKSLKDVPTGTVFVVATLGCTPYIVTDIDGYSIDKDALIEFIRLTEDEPKPTRDAIVPGHYLICVDLRDGELVAFEEDTPIQECVGSFRYHIKE